MRRALFTLALLAAALPARGEGWTKTDTTLQATFVALAVADCVQTEHYLDTGRFREVNPILGDRPSDRRLAIGCASAIVGHTALAIALPKHWRRFWQLSGIFVEGGMLTVNAIFTVRF